MEESIKEIQKVLDDVDKKLTGCLRSIYLRKQTVKDLAKNLKQAKQATKALSRSGVSTRSVFWSAKDWKEKLQECEDVSFQLKAMAGAFGHQKHSLQAAIDKLKEGA